MDIQFKSGQIIYRHISPGHGLQETSRPFQSLDELFTLVMSTQAPFVVDRILLSGQDAQNRNCKVVFAYQSITISEA
jgi:hypothetical protein